MRTSSKLLAICACVAALSTTALAKPNYKTVIKQWSKYGQGQAFFVGRGVYIPLKGEALASFEQLRQSGPPKVVRLPGKTQTAKTTFGIYTPLDEGSFLTVFDRKTQKTIAFGHEGDVSPRIYWTKAK